MTAPEPDHPLILHVEDNADHAELVRCAFQEMGYKGRLQSVTDGQEALDYLFGEGRWAGKRAPKPTLVLLDLGLPKVDGLEVLKKVRAKLKDLTVVVLSVSDAAQDQMEATRLGASLLLRKPSTFDEYERLAGLVLGLLAG